MAGFLVPRVVSDALLKYMGLEPKTKVSIASVTKFFVTYNILNGIHGQASHALRFEVDEELRLALDLKRDVQLTTIGLHKHICASLSKNIDDPKYHQISDEIVSQISHINNKLQQKNFDIKKLREQWNKIGLRHVYPWGEFAVNNFKDFPVSVKNEIMLCLLLWKRLKLPRDLRMLIVSFIATRR